MNEDKYERTIDELETHACKWWPKEVREEAQKISILQALLDSQDKFIAILKLANKAVPSSLFNLIDAAGFSYNLFLKHLVVLVANRFNESTKIFESYFLMENLCSTLEMALVNIHSPHCLFLVF